MEIVDKKIDITAIKEAIKVFGNGFLKSKIAKITAATIICLILLLFLMPFTFNNSQLKFQIEQKISKTYGANFAIKGGVDVAFLPFPIITINDAILRNYRQKNNVNIEADEIYDFYAKSVKIKLSLLSFLSIKEIAIINPILESYSKANLSIARSEKFSGESLNSISKPEEKTISGISAKIFAFNDNDFEIKKLPRVIVKDGDLTIYDKLGNKQNFQLINLEAKIAPNKSNIVGNFVSENNDNSFKFISKYNSNSNRPKSLFELNSAVVKLVVKGNFTSENLGLKLSDFSGKLEAEIFDLKSFYKNYINSESLIYKKLKSGRESIKLSADIKNKAGEIAINNLIINSSLIDGKGDIAVNIAKEIPIIDMNLDLERLDLDDIWSSDVVQNNFTASATELKKDEIQNVNEESGGVITQIKDIDFTAEVAIKNMQYLEGEVKDISLYLSSSKQGEILVLPMILKTPGDGILWLSGVFDNSLVTPKFVGKLDFSGKDSGEILKWLGFEVKNLKIDSLKQYRLRLDLAAMPNKINLSNIYFNLNNSQSEIVGEVDIEYVDKIAKTVSKFVINDFDIDNYFLTSAKNTYFSPGMLVKKMLWLNDLSSSNDIEFKFYKLTYRDEEFFDQLIKLRYGSGYFAIDNLHLKSNTTNLAISLSADITDDNPKFELSLNADNFSYNTPLETAESDSLLDSVIQTIKKDSKRNFLDQFYALPSLEGFQGKVAINFKNLALDKFNVKNLKLNGKLKDGSINVSEMSGDLYGGSFDYRGLIGIKINKIINGNLSLNNVSLQPLLSDLFAIENISGVANISSSIVGAANQKEKFAESINSEIRFMVNSPSIAGYGLTDLMQKMFAKQFYQRELYEPEKILFNPLATTTFKEARGSAQFVGRGEGKFRINVSAPAINGVASGSINLVNNELEGLFSAIFLSGTRQKQVPINIASSIRGDLGDLVQSTNLDQVEQYLKLKSVKLNNLETQ